MHGMGRGENGGSAAQPVCTMSIGTAQPFWMESEGRANEERDVVEEGRNREETSRELTKDRMKSGATSNVLAL